MTTLRRRRVPVPPAADTPHRRVEGAQQVRLALIDPPAERTTLDGAWWPWTRSLSDELPGLVQELHRRGIRVRRVAYHPDAWEATPRRMAADGRTVRLGWFRSIDPQLLDLTGDPDRGRVDLLVVPPDTTAAAAGQAFAAASGRANRRTATAVLAAVLPPAAPAVSPPAAPAVSPRPAVDRMVVGKVTPSGGEPTEVWDSEGGHLFS